MRLKIFKRLKTQEISNPEWSFSVNIFKRYLDNPIFTNNSWGGFQSSIAYWKNLGHHTILVSDGEFDAVYLKSFDEFCNSTKIFDNEKFKKSVFFIRFMHDEDALSEISHIISLGGKFVSSIESVKTPYRFINKRSYLAMQKTWAREESISHLFPVVHENLCEALEITKKIDGIILEIGVYKGGSALTILNYLDLLKMDDTSLPERVYIGIDTFNGFDYEGAKHSPDLIWYKTHALQGVDETLDSVGKLLSDSKTRSSLLVLDICSEELPSDITKISMVNIDVDMYEPTKIALQKASPLVQIGGVIVCEDATSTPALYGASLALHEFCESPEGNNYVRFHKLGQIFLYKIRMHSNMN
jgi:hypothetical protein